MLWKTQRWVGGQVKGILFFRGTWWVEGKWLLEHQPERRKGFSMERHYNVFACAQRVSGGRDLKYWKDREEEDWLWERHLEEDGQAVHQDPGGGFSLECGNNGEWNKRSPRWGERQMEERKGRNKFILLCFQSAFPRRATWRGKQETDRWSKVCWVKLIYSCLIIQVWVLGPKK